LDITYANGQTKNPSGTFVNTEPTITQSESPPQVIGLPVVDGKGNPGRPLIRIPPSVGLTHTVYASTDLAHWTQVTNLTFYFSDPNAPDYDHRFYKFLAK
jgi:hypothetical protein